MTWRAAGSPSALRLGTEWGERMAITPFVSSAVVAEDVAGALKEAGGAASLYARATFWPQVVNLQHTAATNEIYTVLAARGYDAVTQIPLWDRGAEWERNLALLLALTAGGALEQADAKLLDSLRTLYTSDPEKRTGLYAVLLTIAGEGKSPNDHFGIVGSGTSYPDNSGTTPPKGWCQGAFGWRW